MTETRLQAAKNAIDLGIVVGDIDAALHFYVEVLGLELVEKLDIPWGTMHRLRFGESWIKLLAATRDGLTAGPVGIDAGLGLRYFTMEIHGIEAAWDRLTAAGVEVYRPLGPFGDKGLVVAMVLDPDGNVVELVHRPPSARVG